MRTDEQLDLSVRQSKEWKIGTFMGVGSPLGGGEMAQASEDGSRPTSEAADGLYRVHALSGHERNHLFLNERGVQFHDLSGISGLDSVADGRAWVLWDYDRDGWQDVAAVNGNAPLLNLYHNEIGRRGAAGPSTGGRMIAVRFVGGNGTAERSTEYSCRDGYGAVVLVELDGMTLKREHRCGEGFAGQNSATLLVGIGDHLRAKLVSIRWPSGKVQSVQNVAEGTLITAHENPADSPHDSGFAMEPYRRVAETTINPIADGTSPPTLQIARSERHNNTRAPLRMYSTMATWCDACKKHLPQQEQLRAAYDLDELAMFGVPIDQNDGPQKLAEYESVYRPAYRLLVGLNLDERDGIQQVLQANGPDALPSTIVTDMYGRVLKTFLGVPTVSEVAKLLVQGNHSHGLNTDETRTTKKKNRISQ